MMVDSVVEAPDDAHFTTAEPDHRRNEKFQRHYAALIELSIGKAFG